MHVAIKKSLLAFPCIATSLVFVCNMDLIAPHACRAYKRFPKPEVLALSRKMLMLPQGSMLNTCTFDTFAEVLRHLKRAYWPCAWDTGVDPVSAGGFGSHGGFRCAAFVTQEEFLLQLV